MAGKPQYSVAEVVEAIQATGGVVTLAARQLGCPRKTILAYRDRHAAVREALVDAREAEKDVAELTLQDAIAKGEPWAVALYLKTMAKDRGYCERVEQTGAGGAALQQAAPHDSEVAGRILAAAEAIRVEAGRRVTRWPEPPADTPAETPIERNGDGESQTA